MTIDLRQFHDTFFEESFEALDSMEAALLKLDIGSPDPELINTIFRVAHSIKGGSATFGFGDVASFTHTLETLLDELREQRMAVTVTLSDLLLRSVDVMRAMLRAVQGRGPVDSQYVADVHFHLEQAIALRAAPATATLPAPSPDQAAAAAATLAAAGLAAAAGAARGSAPAAATAAALPRWRIEFLPYPGFLLRGNDPLRMLRALGSLGELSVELDTGALPPFAALNPEQSYLGWIVTLDTAAEEAAIREVFDWAEGDCTLLIDRVTAAAEPASTPAAPATAASDPHPDADAACAQPRPAVQPHAAAQSRPALQAAAHAAAPPTPPAALSAAAPAAPAAPGAAPATAPAAAPVTTPVTPPAAVPAARAVHERSPDRGPAAELASAAPTRPDTSGLGMSDSGSIRVSVEKVDELMNTVGELVITQAMLSQLSRNISGPSAEQFRAGIAQLERNMRELQESVMRVRMLPISVVFNRLPRMVRDLAQRLGKQVELKLTGEQTELDKTVLEKIGDPLVHLVRNSIDHGIGTPDLRQSVGKPAYGTIHLHAFHRGGNISVEVSDDGNGLNRERIFAKAVERGLADPGVRLSDAEIHELIFMPGFSTAEHTTDVSGRGVGMDVVRRNVKDLGGTVDVHSEKGVGTRFTLTLPLTLAIVDGQCVAIGSETYIVPLTSIVESLQVKAPQVTRLSGRGEVFAFRGDYLPIIRLHEVFGIQARAGEIPQGLVVVVEGDGRRVGLFVDDLLGQQQAVIKSLETNYGRVEGIAGATILGDGSVSLIVDVPGLIRVTSLRQAA